MPTSVRPSSRPPSRHLRQPSTDGHSGIVLPRPPRVLLRLSRLFPQSAGLRPGRGQPERGVYPRRLRLEMGPEQQRASADSARRPSPAEPGLDALPAPAPALIRISTDLLCHALCHLSVGDVLGPWPGPPVPGQDPAPNAQRLGQLPPEETSGGERRHRVSCACRSSSHRPASRR
jgi:hypothetical protein